MKNEEISNSLRDIFPKSLKTAFLVALNGIRGNVREIRLYENLPAILVTDEGIRFPDSVGGSTSFPKCTSITVDRETLSEIVVNATGASVFSMAKELNEGYVTLKNGIRIGVCLSESDKCFSVDRITSVSIRLPYVEAVQSFSYAKELIGQGGVLIVGAPCSGKTTLLKAFCRELSDIRSPNFKKICIIDTRGELASFSACRPDMYAADIITGKNPGEGILRAVRLMSPEYIICDEICSDYEAQSILEGLNSGVRFISAMHAGSISQLVKRKQFGVLFAENVFTSAVLLSDEQPGKIRKLYGREEIAREIGRSDFDLLGIGCGRCKACL